MQQKRQGYEMEKFYFHPPGHSYPGNSWLVEEVPLFAGLVPLSSENLHTARARVDE